MLYMYIAGQYETVHGYWMKVGRVRQSMATG